MTAGLVEARIPTRDIRVGEVFEFSSSIVGERLDGRQRGRLGAAPATFEDQEKKDNVTNGADSCDDDDGGLARCEVSHFFVQWLRAGGAGWSVNQT